MTRKGERTMNPNFGCDIWNLLFEQIDDASLNIKIENSIMDAVKTWLPYIKVEQIIFDYDDKDIDANTISLDIKFSLASNTSLTGQITIDINN